MKSIYLDRSPAYIPFLVQCTDGTGLKTDPTVDSLIIYEEGGADAAFDSAQISGSPFDPAKVNAKTGLWGVLVPKSALTANKWYIALWEMTVAGIATAKVERYFCCNLGTAQTGDTYSAILALGSVPDTAHVFNAGEKIVVARGDTVNLPFALGAAYNCTGKRLFFAVRNDETDAIAINLECTLTDETNVIGTVPLTTALLASVLAGTYEYERRDADGTSNPYTIVQGPFRIMQDVRQ